MPSEDDRSWRFLHVRSPDRNGLKDGTLLSCGAQTRELWSAMKDIVSNCQANIKLLRPGLDKTRLFISLTAGAGTRCMSLLSSSPTLSSVDWCIVV